mgnify:FL=1
MKDYLYDYKKSSFKTVNNSGKKNYYIKINQDYIEITEDVYKTCKSSYDKLRYTYKQEVAHSVSHYEDMDIATSFCLHQNVSAINKLLLTGYNIYNLFRNRSIKFYRQENCNTLFYLWV